MIISEIQAGLGNQLFMYAAGKFLSERLGEEFKLDLTWFNSWPKNHCKRPYALDKFNISAKIASKKEIKKFVNKTFSRYGYRIVEELNFFKKGCYIEKYHKLEDFFKIKNGDVYLKGYFINSIYFKEIESILKKEFSLKEEYKKNIKELLKKIKKQNSVAVHIRRGDQVGTTHESSVRYYSDCINTLKTKTKNPEFYIFSDDIKWCKTNLRQVGEFNYVENFREYEDFELMKNCKNQIISKSTFSWWAAYLNSNKNKIIISPNNFYDRLYKEI